jgi:DNA-binding CsgD family transcriptional regulator
MPMVTSLEDFISVSSRLSSGSALLELFLKTVEAEGYQNAVFAKARDRRLTSIPWNRFPTGYEDAYRALEWDKIDPIVQHIHCARRPFRWADLCAHADLTGKQKIFLHQCRELGVHSGVTIPLHGPGTEIDLISLSLRDEKTDTADRLGMLYAISAQYWLKFNELNDPPAPKEMHLTTKELECLRWCKEGKTNWEIGEIMSTSEKTVEFHLSNAIRKLGACNRITAVVIAIRCGLISL